MSPILNQIAFFSVLAPPLVAVIFFKRISVRQGILAGFCLVSMGLQLMGKLVSARLGTDLPNFHFYILIEFLAFSSIFYLEWKKQPLGKIIRWIMIGFVLLAIFSAIWYPGAMNMPTLTQTVGHLIILGFACIFMWKTFQNMTYERLDKVFMFWFSIGILIFFTSTLLQSIFGEFITANENIYNSIWAIRDIFNILFYLVCTIAILCKDQRTW